MMSSKNEYAIYRRFWDVGQAEELAERLRENNIDCKLVDNSPPVDITFSGNTLQNEVQLMLKTADFEHANQLLKDEANESIDQVNPDHYLFDFENDELYDILIKPEEWSPFDYQLTKKILIDRGKSIDEDLINSLQKQRIDDLAKPEEGQSAWIVMGYVFAFLGGLLGIFIGWYISNSKKTLPNGQKIYSYSDKDRKHGRSIFFAGIICFCIWMAIRIILGLESL